MLTRLDLRLFKCFELLKLPLAPLTLLSGPNSSGKSSILQALVLLHQTMREHEWSTRLALNGAAVHLGTVVDVVDEVNGRAEFEIGVATEDSACCWTFEGGRRTCPCGCVACRSTTARPTIPGPCVTCCRRWTMEALRRWPI